MKRQKNQHEWGVVVEPSYSTEQVEFCPLCNKYQVRGEKWTWRQFVNRYPAEALLLGVTA